MTTLLDDIDLAIVRATQEGLPLTPMPYAVVAEQLGLDHAQVMERLKAMLAAGIIRRIGAVPNHYALGYTANGMAVWDIDDTLVAGLGPQVGALDFVSHCYRRPRRLPLWRYNLFAMIHGRTRMEVDEKITQINQLLGNACRAHEILYSSQILKKTGLRF